MGARKNFLLGSYHDSLRQRKITPSPKSSITSKTYPPEENKVEINYAIWFHSEILGLHKLWYRPPLCHVKIFSIWFLLIEEVNLINPFPLIVLVWHSWRWKRNIPAGIY